MHEIEAKYLKCLNFKHKNLHDVCFFVGTFFLPLLEAWGELLLSMLCETNKEVCIYNYICVYNILVYVFIIYMYSDTHIYYEVCFAPRMSAVAWGGVGWVGWGGVGWVRWRWRIDA